MPFRQSAMCGVVSGSAPWATLGTLDIYLSPRGVTRAALLPSLSRWFVLVVIFTLVFAGIIWLITRVGAGRRGDSGSTADMSTATRNMLRPLLWAGLLTLPLGR